MKPKHSKKKPRKQRQDPLQTWITLLIGFGLGYATCSVLHAIIEPSTQKDEFEEQITYTSMDWESVGIKLPYEDSGVHEKVDWKSILNK